MSTLQERIAEDLESSGLTAADIMARPLDNPARAATRSANSQEGYVIPYTTIRGGPAQFYRVKLFDSDPKYKQPLNTPNHVYFPKGFLQAAAKHSYVILTEGEKKAACAVKNGIPCAALGGADSWRNRILTLDVAAELTQTDKTLKARLPSGSEVTEDYTSPIALGLQDLIDFCIATDKHLILLYDQDPKVETSHNVQKAAASLGYELRFKGVAYNRIRQIRLPVMQGFDKLGLDDYIVNFGVAPLTKLIEACVNKRAAFPRHPNVRDYINKRLQKAKMSRKEMQQVSMAILSELDAQGIRLRSKQEMQTYYFDQKTHKLLRAVFSNAAGNSITESAFGQFLYRTYGIGSADARLIEWLGTQFTGEEPVEDVSPFRVFARPNQNKDNVIYQVADGQYVEVDAGGVKFYDNGTNSVLFESEQVVSLDLDKLKKELEKQFMRSGTPDCWWADVLSQVRLVDQSQTRMAAALMYYIAPWLNRWRGTQLPIEMILGEAGSGKSTLFELRLEMITGIPLLRNAPQDWKDWAASVAGTGGLHVTDNLVLSDKNLRQRLSDDICRIITEPNPTIEQRKLYTNNDMVRLPVRCQFGITAIKQPFLNADVLARAFVVELDKSKDLINGSLSYDAAWKSNQMNRFGGREAWIAHHLYILHLFFKQVQKKWNMAYQAKYRLINVEQALSVMAEVFGLDGKWIAGYLNGATNKAVQEADWAFEGIIAYAATRRQEYPDNYHKKGFHASDIADWAEGVDEYKHCEELTNSRRCGRYLQTHKTMVASVAGIVEDGKANNRVKYRLEQKKPN